jgi:predicted acylesterase/phospholipase RssA
MGAYVGGMYAMGMDPDEMDAHCYDEWVRRRPLGDYTVPRHALIRGHRFEAMLKRVFGTVTIEELGRGFFCASADLRSGELVVSRTGAMWDAVGLSMCLPILAPPQVRGSRLLIDGSLVDNLPVATMAAEGDGPVIAVDVKPSYGPSDGRRAGKEAAAPAEPRALRVPALGETVTRILLLGSENTSEAARRHADVVIAPRTDGVGLFEFHQLDQAREAGRAAARAALDDGLALPA